MRPGGQPVAAPRMVNLSSPARARRLAETHGGRFSVEMGLAPEAGLNLHDVEAALIHLWLAHDRKLRHCAGGARCFALSGPAPLGSGGNR